MKYNNCCWLNCHQYGTQRCLIEHGSGVFKNAVIVVQPQSDKWLDSNMWEIKLGSLYEYVAGVNIDIFVFIYRQFEAVLIGI